jgi:hypothetical protein
MQKSEQWLGEPGVGASSRVIVNAVVESLVGFWLLAPATVHAVFPNVKLFGPPMNRIELTTSVLRYRLSAEEVDQLEREYWDAFAPRESYISEPSKPSDRALVAKATRHLGR